VSNQGGEKPCGGEKVGGGKKEATDLANNVLKVMRFRTDKKGQRKRRPTVGKRGKKECRKLSGDEKQKKRENWEKRICGLLRSKGVPGGRRTRVFGRKNQKKQ